MKVSIILICISVILSTGCNEESAPINPPPKVGDVRSVETPSPTPKPETIESSARKFISSWLDGRLSKKNEFFRRCGVVKNERDEVSEILTIDNLYIAHVTGASRMGPEPHGVTWTGEVTLKASQLTAQRLEDSYNSGIELVRHPEVKLSVLKNENGFAIGELHGNVDEPFNYWYRVEVSSLTPFPCHEIAQTIAKLMASPTPTPTAINENDAKALIQVFLGYAGLNTDDTLSPSFERRMSTKYREKGLTLDEISKFNREIRSIGTDNFRHIGDTRASIDVKLQIPDRSGQLRNADFYTFTFVVAADGNLRIDAIENSASKADLPLNIEDGEQ